MNKCVLQVIPFSLQRQTNQKCESINKTLIIIKQHSNNICIWCLFFYTKLKKYLTPDRIQKGEVHRNWQN